MLVLFFVKGTVHNRAAVASEEAKRLRAENAEVTTKLTATETDATTAKTMNSVTFAFLSVKKEYNIVYWWNNTLTKPVQISLAPEDVEKDSNFLRKHTMRRKTMRTGPHSTIFALHARTHKGGLQYCFLCAWG